MPDDDGRAEREYRIDELARLAGTTVRNVRAYQDRGILPSPRRQGRIGLYSATHLARLRLVAALLDRGYTLGNIAELLGAWERGQDISDVLGFEVALVAPWSEEPPTTISAADLSEIFGNSDERVAADALAEAITLGIVEPEGPGFRVASPRMLETGRLLVGEGVPLEAVLELTRRMHDDIDDVAEMFVEIVETHIFDQGDAPLTPAEIPRLSDLVQRLRPLAKQVVDAELSQAMDRHIQARFGDRIGRLATTLPDEAS